MTCQRCGASFELSGARRAYELCQPCRYEYRSGANHYGYKGGYINTAGYRIIYVDRVPISEHRHLMAMHLGRALQSHEIVHHKDHNRSNNALGNLELISSQSEHMSGHLPGGYRTATEKQCIDCKDVKPRTEFYRSGGRFGDPHKTRCKPCYYAHHIKWRDSKRCAGH